MLSSYRGNSDAPAGATSGKAILVSVDGLTAPAPVLIVTADSPYSIPENLSSGQLYMLDTAGGALTLTLPATPSDGQQVAFKRITTDGNTLTIARNGKLIEGAASDYKNSSTALAAFVFEYSADNGSWWLVGQALAPASSVAVGNITGLGTGVATWLATPSSANLASCVTGETGTGSLVFATQPVFANTIGVGGATASNSGSGITFPATQAASTNANTLDDYEKGTWTPALTFGGGSTGITYNKQTGFYTKIGRFVNAQFTIQLTNKGSSSGAASVSGFPFTSADYSVGTSQILLGAALAGTPFPILTNGTTASLNYFPTATGTPVNLTEANFTNSSQIFASVFNYFV